MDEGLLMDEEIKIEGPQVNLDSRISRFKYAIWQLLEDPQSSTTALCVSIFSLAMTVFSILILCIGADVDAALPLWVLVSFSFININTRIRLDSLPQLDKLMKAFDTCHPGLQLSLVSKLYKIQQNSILIKVMKQQKQTGWTITREIVQKYQSTWLCLRLKPF